MTTGTHAHLNFINYSDFIPVILRNYLYRLSYNSQLPQSSLQIITILLGIIIAVIYIQGLSPFGDYAETCHSLILFYYGRPLHLNRYS